MIENWNPFKASVRYSNKDQRLRDAKIGKEKKQKVLEAIWDKFTADEEFYRINANDFKVSKLKYLQNWESFQVQFSRIAQSSIMKLNEVSMSKLFDLMIMVRVSSIFKNCMVVKAKTVGHHK